MSASRTPSRPSELSGAPPVAKPPLETAERRALIRELFDQNLTRGEIAARCQERWTVSAASVRADIRRIEREQRNDPSLQDLRREVVRVHRGIRTRALSRGELGTARLANRDLARWTGLDLGDVIVIGGGPDGATAGLASVVDVARALRARREQAELPERVVDADVVATNGRNGHG